MMDVESSSLWYRSSRRTARVRVRAGKIRSIAWHADAMIVMPAALAAILAIGLLAEPYGAEGQAAGNVHHVGIIYMSGHHHVVVDGLRQGLRELGLEEGKHLVLDIRETKGDVKAAEEAARDLERGKVDVT